jgi:hypothetical protein
MEYKPELVAAAPTPEVCCISLVCLESYCVNDPSLSLIYPLIYYALAIYCKTPLLYPRVSQLCIDLTHSVVEDYVTKPGTKKFVDAVEA